MSYKLFLDDVRFPRNCIYYMESKLGDITIYKEKFVIARSYYEFIQNLEEKGAPEFISFDHDLGYNEDTNEEKTGYDCAKYLVDYCLKNNIKVPDYVVHSMNPVGERNIIEYIENYKKNIT